MGKNLLLLPLTIICLALSADPVLAANRYQTENAFKQTNAKFTWAEAKNGLLAVLHKKKFLRGRVQWGRKFPAFFISPEGYFVTSYLIVKDCLKSKDKVRSDSKAIPCYSKNKREGLVAFYKGEEYTFDIVSHLKKEDAMGTPRSTEDLFKSNDVVIGKMNLPKSATVGFYSFAPTSAAKQTYRGRVTFNKLSVYLPHYFGNNFHIVTGDAGFAIPANLKDDMGIGFIPYRDSTGKERAKLIETGFIIGDVPAIQRATAPSHIGSPVLDTEGLAYGFVFSVPLTQPFAIARSKELILKTYFSTEEPGGGALFSIVVGKTRYYLKK